MGYYTTELATRVVSCCFYELIVKFVRLFRGLTR